MKDCFTFRTNNSVLKLRIITVSIKFTEMMLLFFLANVRHCVLFSITFKYIFFVFTHLINLMPYSAQNPLYSVFLVLIFALFKLSVATCLYPLDLHGLPISLFLYIIGLNCSTNYVFCLKFLAYFKISSLA